ncbi:MAG: ribosomal protein S18-alanine N-acetyltransferase [Thermodesulfovibrionales bacterium]
MKVKLEGLFIRNMWWSDIPQVLNIERMSFSTPWNEMAFLNEIYNSSSIVKVAVYENKIVGYICANSVVDEGHILNIAVSPNMRRMGIATVMLEKVIDELKKKGCRSIYLEVRASNTIAIKFYENFGFVSVGKRRNYYTLPKEDAIVMMLALLS